MRTKVLLNPYYYIKQPQILQFPDDNSLSFDRYLTGILNVNGDIKFNFMFSDGSASQLGSNLKMKEHRIEPDGRAIKRI